MRKLLVLMMLCPLAALAQGPGGGNGAGAGQNGRGQGRGMAAMDPEQAEKRMKLARILGLAEALDLETADALELGKTLEKFDPRREAARKQQRDAREQLQKLARADAKVAPAEVDQAVQKLFDARAQLLAADREMVAAVSKTLPPEKRARAALFLGRFEERMEKRVLRFRGPGGMGGHVGFGPGPDRPPRAFVFRGPGEGPQDQLELCMDEGCPGLEDE